MFQFNRGTLVDMIGPTKADLWLVPINEALTLYGIDTKQRACYFLGQILVESLKFTKLEENLNYISPDRLVEVYPKRITHESATSYIKNPEKLANFVYGGRLGNHDIGDGWKYRGRGLIQLTGRANYAEASQALGHDFINFPEALLEPKWAARSAAWFWQRHGLNKYADKSDVHGLTVAVNGGENGIMQRVTMTASVLRLC